LRFYARRAAAVPEGHDVGRFDPIAPDAPVGGNPAREAPAFAVPGPGALPGELRAPEIRGHKGLNRRPSAGCVQLPPAVFGALRLQLSPGLVQLLRPERDPLRPGRAVADIDPHLRIVAGPAPPETPDPLPSAVKNCGELIGAMRGA
jgi:hypothetical protein